MTNTEVPKCCSSVTNHLDELLVSRVWVANLKVKIFALNTLPVTLGVCTSNEFSLSLQKGVHKNRGLMPNTNVFKKMHRLYHLAGI